MNLRFFTRDEAPQQLRAAFYTVEKLSEKRAWTPEGFLVCYDVPIARTGSMTYVAGEIPVDAGADGLITVVREAADVFTDAHIKSYLGKPVIDNHPQGDDGSVNPENFTELSRGTVLSPRRGEGALADCLVADLLICDKNAIEQVLAGKLEVSCGYDADYEPIGPGKGRQKNLIGNHVALVDAGRCGPRCAIGDRKATSSSGETMSACTKDKKPNWLDRIKAALTTKDDKLIAAAVTAAESEMSGSTNDGEGGVHVHLHSGGGKTGDELPDDPEKQYRDGVESRFGEMNKKIEDGFKRMSDAYDALGKRLDAFKPGPAEEDVTDAEATKEIEGQLKEEAPPGTNDAAIKAGTKDSVLLVDAFQEAVAGAEILVPGMQMPTYDKAAKTKVTLDSLCNLRRKSLELHYATTDGKAAIDSISGGATLDFAKMPCGQERVLFRAAVGLAKQRNNMTQDRATEKTKDKDAPKPVRTAADLNERNRKHYAQN